MAEKDRSTKKLTCRTIIEIAGYPKEYVEETMERVVKTLKEIPKIKVLSHETVPAEQIEKMFSTFTEFDIEFPEFEALMQFCFNFMPSSVEILEGKDTFDVAEVTGILNDMMAQLHKYDMVVKNLRAKVHLLENPKNEKLKPK